MRSRRLRIWTGLAIGILATSLSAVMPLHPNPNIRYTERGMPWRFILFKPGRATGARIRLGTQTVELPAVTRASDRHGWAAPRSESGDVVLDPRPLLADLAFWSGLALALLGWPRKVRGALTWGAVVTALLALFPWEFCMDGGAHGLPYAIVHPHEATVPGLAISLPAGEMGRVIDLVGFLRDWLLWSGVVLVFLAGRARVRDRKARGRSQETAALPGS